MKKNLILSQLINDLLGNSLEELKKDINKNKLLIDHITEELKSLDYIDDFSGENLQKSIRLNKELLVHNYILLSKQEELAAKQEEVAQYISDVLTITNDDEVQNENEQSPYSVNAANLEKEEELYVLRQIRNFYLKHNDFDNCHKTIEQIKDLREKN